MEQDRAEPVKWFRKAATGGDSRGQHDLAVASYSDGALVVTDEIAPGLPLPWAGVIWMPGEQSMQLVVAEGQAGRFEFEVDEVEVRWGDWGWTRDNPSSDPTTARTSWRRGSAPLEI